MQSKTNNIHLREWGGREGRLTQRKLVSLIDQSSNNSIKRGGGSFRVKTMFAGVGVVLVTKTDSDEKRSGGRKSENLSTLGRLVMSRALSHVGTPSPSLSITAQLGIGRD